MAEKERCDFCGEPHKWVSLGTAYHGPYCEGCLRMSRFYDLEALHEIRDRKRKAKEKT
jgi:late competence protein required for DNA uptake (superfamily II DNA/RNA helicase)